MAERNCPIEKASVYLEENTWCGKSKRLSTKFRIIFVQLSKFKNKELNEELLEPLSKIMKDWAKFFIDRPESIISSDQGMKEAQYIWTKVSGDKVVKAQIKAIEKYEMDKKSEITTARNDGRQEGLIEGKKEGLIEGKKSEQKQIALNMKNQGLENDFIAKCLNISIDNLKKLLM